MRGGGLDLCAECRRHHKEDCRVSKRSDSGRKKSVENFCVGSDYCDTNIGDISV